MLKVLRSECMHNLPPHLIYDVTLPGNTLILTKYTLYYFLNA